MFAFASDPRQALSLGKPERVAKTMHFGTAEVSLARLFAELVDFSCGIAEVFWDDPGLLRVRNGRGNQRDHPIRSHRMSLSDRMVKLKHVGSTEAYALSLTDRWFDVLPYVT